MSESETTPGTLSDEDIRTVIPAGPTATTRDSDSTDPDSDGVDSTDSEGSTPPTRTGWIRRIRMVSTRPTPTRRQPTLHPGSSPIAPSDPGAPEPVRR